MNFKLLAKTLGLLLMLIGTAMLLCYGFEWISPEAGPRHDEAMHALGLSTAIAYTVGLILLVWGRRSGRELFRREAVAIVGLGWLVSSAAGALPYIFCDPGLNPAQAFFESTSGFTTTGSTVIADLNEYPRSILLWRALTQWLGGMGILVLFVAVLSFFGVGGKILFRHESSARQGGGFQTRIRETALRLWQIYIVLSFLCALGLMSMGMSVYDALTHAFAALSTGGFSVRNESIAYYSSAMIDAWLTLFMTLGGASFMFYAWMLRQGLKRIRMGEEIGLYLLLICAFTAALTVDLLGSGRYSSAGEALRFASFQTVSIMTTTGYVTADYDQWSVFARAALVTLMFIGGCAGSTAGGVKVGRVLLFFKIVRQEITTAFRPNQVIPLRLNGSPVPDSQRSEALFFLCLTGGVVAASTLLVSAMEGQLGVADAFSGVVATLFNIGPGLGAIGAVKNFSELGSFTCMFLSMLMILGRLEFMALLALFTPALWRRY